MKSAVEAHHERNLEAILGKLLFPLHYQLQSFPGRTLKDSVSVASKRDGLESPIACLYFCFPLIEFIII